MGQAARELDECYSGMVISAGTGEEDGESGEDGEGAAEGEEDPAVYQIRIDETTADRDDENGYGVSIHGAAPTAAYYAIQAIGSAQEQGAEAMDESFHAAAAVDVESASSAKAVMDIRSVRLRCSAQQTRR